MQRGLLFFVHGCRIDIKEAGEIFFGQQEQISTILSVFALGGMGYNWSLHCLEI